jgi:hypothetical protein
MNIIFSFIEKNQIVILIFKAAAYNADFFMHILGIIRIPKNMVIVAMQPKYNPGALYIIIGKMAGHAASDAIHDYIYMWKIYIT